MPHRRDAPPSRATNVLHMSFITLWVVGIAALFFLAAIVVALALGAVY